ncbi:MAG: rRNA maturation RNase YbeY [Spirochaetales bacterium]|nr:rRNA maturation RNase YbeY [Spirochaetales bacterium]
MSTVDILTQSIDTPDWIDRYRIFCERLLDYLGFEIWEISILLCDDEMIRNLNAEYRSTDEATDVLSFSQIEGTQIGKGQESDGGNSVHAGDIVLSLPRIHENARLFGVPPEEELKRLTIHGLLHLSGMDHTTNHPTEIMLEKQETILREVTEEPLF